LANDFFWSAVLCTAENFGASASVPSSFVFLEGLAPARPKDFGTAEANDEGSVGA
jgi:hypothetical protein